jgi:hypothetical protein
MSSEGEDEKRVNRQPVPQGSICGRRKGEGGKRESGIRISHRRLAFKYFEDVLVVGVVHLQRVRRSKTAALDQRSLSAHLLNTCIDRKKANAPPYSRAFPYFRA